MHFIEKQVDGGLGVIKYAEAGALVPVGKLQFEVQMFDTESTKIGEIRKIRTTDVFVEWNGINIRYPDDIGITKAVLLAERIFSGNPRDHEELKEVVNGFAREFYEATAKKAGDIEIT